MQPAFWGIFDPLVFLLDVHIIFVTSHSSKVIRNHPGIGFHFYADDTQLYVHLTHKNVSHAFDRLERCLEDVKKWLSANKLKLNPDKTEFIVFGSKIHREKLNKSFPVNILGNFLSPLGVGLIVIFPSRGMSKIPASLVLAKLGILGVSEVTSHIMLPLWLRMLWLEVDLTTVIPCLKVSQLLIFVSCNVFKIVWLELSPTPPSTHTSLLLGRFYIGCLLNNAPYLRLPYWCTSS